MVVKPTRSSSRWEQQNDDPCRQISHPINMPPDLVGFRYSTWSLFIHSEMHERLIGVATAQLETVRN